MSPTDQRAPEVEREVGAAVVFPGRGLLGMQERDQHQQAPGLLRGQLMHASALDQDDADARPAERLPAPETIAS